MLLSALRITAESALNRLIRRDPTAWERLASQAGLVFALQLKHPSLRLTVTPTTDGLMWRTDDDLKADAIIHSSGPGLLAALQRQHDRGRDMDALFAGDLVIEGNEAAATRFLRTLRGLEIDWADWLAKYIGVSPAGVIEQAARQARDNAAEWRETRRLELHDYLVHEAQLVADAFDLPDFLDTVDETRTAVERLERRLIDLETRVTQQPRTSEI
ncbi:MAG TPA: SCP2 sterol-binding domain-containing protein [Guyparkeria sp.]|nr:SCP2 sterol-binding domain-containing protein [Guyparkeria sp.]